MTLRKDVTDRSTNRIPQLASFGVAAALLLVLAPTARSTAQDASAEAQTRHPARSAVAVDRQGTAEARQQPSLRLFRAWLAAFNSGDRARYARFLKRNFPISGSADRTRDMGLREFTGGFDLRKLGRVSVTRVSGWVQERDSDQFVCFVLWVSAAKPPEDRPLVLEAISRPAEFPIARLTEGEAIAGVEALLRKQAAADRFSGAALVAKDGEVRFAGAYGQADRERGIPNTIETRFRIGSMNKMFTAVATLQLVEAGKLALDDPVGKHLRGYPNSEVATKVTVRHLLTHTGGTGDIFGPEYDPTACSCGSTPTT